MKNSRIIEIRTAIISGKKTATEFASESFAKFEDSENLHALTEILPAYAMERAEKIDAEIREIREKNNDDFAKTEAEVLEKIGVLAGVPYIAKDNFLTKAGHSTASSTFFANFKSPIDSTAVKKLDEAGAIMIGKSNLDAFAHGGSTENSAFGATKNAYDETRVAGGSSGGSAAIVAAGVVPFALGSDTGGSIREPASFNGVFGWKPTYGLISRWGVFAMASSTDVIGTFTETAEDAEILTEVLEGKDGHDGTLHEAFFAKDLKKIREENSVKKVGIIKEFLGDGVDPKVRESALQFAKTLRENGYEVDEVSLPMSKYALAIYYIVVPAELSSNLARFDGVRYGARAGEKFVKISEQKNRFITKDSEIAKKENLETEARNPEQMFVNSRNFGFADENKRRLMIGAFVLSSGYFDAYYLKAQKVRTLLIREFNELFEKYDFLVGPVAPTPAFKLGANTTNPLAMYMSDVMTTPASMAGIPALSIPWTNVKSDENVDLPVGMQIMGQQKNDAAVLEFSRKIEEIRDKNKEDK